MARKKIAIRHSQTMSKRFSFLSGQRIDSLKQLKLKKKKTEAKVNWAVTAYNDWRRARLSDLGYDENIFKSDLGNLSQLEKITFEHSMCFSIAEVH